MEVSNGIKFSMVKKFLHIRVVTADFKLDYHIIDNLWNYENVSALCFKQGCRGEGDKNSAPEGVLVRGKTEYKWVIDIHF